MSRWWFACWPSTGFYCWKPYAVRVRVVLLSGDLNDWNGFGEHHPGHLLVARHAGVDTNGKEVLLMFLSELVDNLGQRYSLSRALPIGLREIVVAGLRFSEQRLKKAMVRSGYIYDAYSSLAINIPWNHKGYILPTDIASHPDISLACGV